MGGFSEEAGCGLAVMANNHTGDYGEDALSYTTELLTGHSIPYIGAGSDIDEAYSAYRLHLERHQRVDHRRLRERIRHRR